MRITAIADAVTGGSERRASGRGGGLAPSGKRGTRGGEGSSPVVSVSPASALVARGASELLRGGVGVVGARAAGKPGLVPRGRGGPPRKRAGSDLGRGGMGAGSLALTGVGAAGSGLRGGAPERGSALPQASVSFFVAGGS